MVRSSGLAASNFPTRPSLEDKDKAVLAIVHIRAVVFFLSQNRKIRLVNVDCRCLPLPIFYPGMIQPAQGRRRNQKIPRKNITAQFPVTFTDRVGP